MRTTRWIAVSLLVAAASPAFAAEPWNDVAPLIGSWVGEGSGRPGDSGGTFTFAQELGSSVVTRKAHSEYPATKDRPAFAHDDLMVLFHEGGATKAIYFDNEGHTIRYTATAEANRLVFLSDPAPGPRFRLTYDWATAGVLKISFEIAAPGETAFKTYVQGTAKKKA
jgi:hypothetical protein